MSASLAISQSGSETRVEFFLDGAALYAESGMTIAAAIIALSFIVQAFTAALETL